MSAILVIAVQVCTPLCCTVVHWATTSHGCINGALCLLLNKNSTEMKRKLLAIALIMPFSMMCAKKAKFGYSAILVPEEIGMQFEKITDDNDNVADYDGNIVSRTSNVLVERKITEIRWWVLSQIAISPDGQQVGYISRHNRKTYIKIKCLSGGRKSLRLTVSANVYGLSWGLDGKTLCYTEMQKNRPAVCLFDLEQGASVKKIVSDKVDGLGGVISENGKTVFFHGQDSVSKYAIWSYDMTTGKFAKHIQGMTVDFAIGSYSEAYCARLNDKNESSIWRINLETGEETQVLAEQGKSFTTPNLSPDGKWLIVTGNSAFGKEGIANTDIYALRTDGSRLTQLTYHPGNDLSPIWSPDGGYIYFLSQRGSSDGVYNIWKMNFPL